MKTREWWAPLVWWVYTALAVTGICGLVYWAVQQDLRMSLNDPQIQLAEDAARSLSAGASVKSVVPTQLVDIKNSLAPYVNVYDAEGKPIAGSGYFEGSLAAPPPSAIESGWRRSGAHSFFSWQPEPDVRSAVVVAPYTSAQGNGYVVAGRNMREVENRIIALGFEVLIAWVVTLGCLLVASYLAWFLLR